MLDINFCKYCGSPVKQNDETSYTCEKGHNTYNNPVTGVMILILRGGELLLGRRARDPAKGTLDAIGGFVDYGEQALDAAYREAKEETGCEIEIIDIASVQCNYYQDKTFACSPLFIAQFKDPDAKPQADDDVSELVWVKIGEKIPEEQLSTKRMVNVLQDVADWYVANSSKIA